MDTVHTDESETTHRLIMTGLMLAMFALQILSTSRVADWILSGGEL